MKVFLWALLGVAGLVGVVLAAVAWLRRRPAAPSADGAATSPAPPAGDVTPAGPGSTRWGSPFRALVAGAVDEAGRRLGIDLTDEGRAILAAHAALERADGADRFGGGWRPSPALAPPRPSWNLWNVTYVSPGVNGPPERRPDAVAADQTRTQEFGTYSDATKAAEHYLRLLRTNYPGALVGALAGDVAAFSRGLVAGRDWSPGRARKWHETSEPVYRAGVSRYVPDWAHRVRVA